MQDDSQLAFGSMDWRTLHVDGPVGTSPVTAHVADAPDIRVLLARTADGTLHATVTACPHLGQPLVTGEVDGDVLECDHHHYRYRLADGVCVGPGGPLAGRLTVHELREDRDGVRVRLATPSGGAAER